MLPISRTYYVSIIFRFLAGKLGEPFKYIGFNIHHSPNGMILDQQDYIDSPDLPSVKNRRSNMKNDPLKSSEHKVFRGIVGQPN